MNIQYKIRIAFIIVLVFAFESSVFAVVMRHDIAPEKYLAKESEFPAVFPLFRNGNNKECVATLIESDWAITAAHCAALLKKGQGDKVSHLIKIQDKANKIIQVKIPKEYGQIEPLFNSNGELVDLRGVEDPSFDVALLKLESAAKNVSPINLYLKDNEVNKAILLLGWGDKGYGDKGYAPTKPENDGRFRQAWNIVEGVDGNFMTFTFDAPKSKKSMELEGVAGPGDSGGPALVLFDSEYKLLGISSGGGYPDDYRGDSGNFGKYGWREYYVRISSMKEWITQVIRNN